MTPHPDVARRLRNVLAFVVLLGILAGCGSSPVVTPRPTVPASSAPSASALTSFSPFPSALTSPAGLATRPPNPTPSTSPRIVPTSVGASLAGSVRGLVVVEVVDEPHGKVAAARLASFDPATHRWSWTDLPAPFVSRWSRVASDGSSVALASAGSALWLNLAGQTQVLVPRIAAKASQDWPQDGLVARTGGGYVAAGTATLDAITADGQSITDVALPAGYLMVAPTSDPNRFILARVSDVPMECGLPCALAVTLWTRSTGALTRISGYAGGIEPATGGLSYLHLATGWSLLASDGQISPINTPKVPGTTQVDTISPDGYVAAFGCGGGPGTGGPPGLTGSCKLEIGKPGSIAGVVGFTPYAVFEYQWSSDNRLAILTGGGDWVGLHGMNLVIVDAASGRVVTSAAVPTP